MNVTLLSLLIGLAAFIIVVLLYTVFNKTTNDEKAIDRIENFNEKNNTDKIISKLGIDLSDYLLNCNIANKKPDLNSLVLYRIVGMALLILGVFLTIITLEFPYLLFGAICCYFLMKLPTNKMKNLANERKDRLASELPRFLDLLLSALKAKMSITVAIQTTCDSIDGVISDEMKLALASVEMGNKNWQSALLDMAKKFENDEFSDFVLDLTTSYEKGVSIIESVERKSSQIKKSNLLAAKEKSSKMSSTVLIPIMIFKLIPLISLFVIPIAIQLMDSTI